MNGNVKDVAKGKYFCKMGADRVSLRQEDIDKIEELLELAQRNDTFWMTTSDFREFEDNVMDVLYEEFEKSGKVNIK